MAPSADAPASPTVLAGADLKPESAPEAWAAAQAIAAAAQRAAQRELAWDTPLLPFGPVLMSLAARGGA